MLVAVCVCVCVCVTVCMLSPLQVYSKVCQYLKQQLKSVETPEDMYYATAAAAALGSSCDVSPPTHYTS